MSDALARKQQADGASDPGIGKRRVIHGRWIQIRLDTGLRVVLLGEWRLWIQARAGLRNLSLNSALLSYRSLRRFFFDCFTAATCAEGLAH
jgi:hypothetical protein